MGRVKDQIRWSLEYLTTTYDQDNLGKKRSELRTKLYDYILENGEPDENGNLIFRFEKPTSVSEDEWYAGLMLQRRVAEFVDDDVARQIIESHGLEERCIKQITEDYIDYDALYACNQEGIISDTEIDSILSKEETWALVKMRA